MGNYGVLVRTITYMITSVFFIVFILQLHKYSPIYLVTDITITESKNLMDGHLLICLNFFCLALWGLFSNDMTTIFNIQKSQYDSVCSWD